MARYAKSFSGATVEEARRKLKEWMAEHPDAMIVIEHKPIVMTPLRGAANTKNHCSISIEYEE